MLIQQQEELIAHLKTDLARGRESEEKSADHYRQEIMELRGKSLEQADLARRGEHQQSRMADEISQLRATLSDKDNVILNFNSDVARLHVEVARLHSDSEAQLKRSAAAEHELQRTCDELLRVRDECGRARGELDLALARVAEGHQRLAEAQALGQQRLLESRQELEEHVARLSGVIADREQLLGEQEKGMSEMEHNNKEMGERMEALRAHLITVLEAHSHDKNSKLLRTQLKKVNEMQEKYLREMRNMRRLIQHKH
jgi:chromosome segregation ATPase